MPDKEKKQRILLIVESPVKVKSIRQFLPSNYIIMASAGHITEIANTGKFNLGIDIDNGFEINYEVSDSKKEIVSKLKEQVKLADKVILATDPDREGESISQSLKEVLRIPDSKYERVTYHEVTKNAVLKALENPRKIDDDLVHASRTRQRLDKMVGYRLSNLVRDKIGAKSAGRCQSPGLRLVVEREREIQDFKPVTYYDLYLNFSKNKAKFKAKYQGKDGKEAKQIQDPSIIDGIVNDCKGNDFKIKSVEKKESLENPKPPFCTSTFQQEASRRLGIGVKDVMSLCQKLFEGVDINGKHIGLITYHRTDSTEYAPEFIPLLKNAIEGIYGKDSFQEPKKGKKNENAQDGHEALRPVDLSMTPDKASRYLNDGRLAKIYEMIYNRTIQSGMKPAVYNDTIYTIGNNGHEFILKSRELAYEGWRKAYGHDDEESQESAIRETFSNGETLKGTSLEEQKKETQPPKRYTEATLLKELDKKGIGRPSTYATIVSTILDPKRDYCKVEDKTLVPTEKGMRLIGFLEKSFGNLVDYGYTSELEKSLDLIAEGKLDDVAFLRGFYSQLCEDIDKAYGTSEKRTCPECGREMTLRKGRYGLFWGCSGYPECRHIESVKEKTDGND